MNCIYSARAETWEARPFGRSDGAIIFEFLNPECWHGLINRNHPKRSDFSRGRIKRPAGNYTIIVYVLSVDDGAGEAWNQILEILDRAILPDESQASAGKRTRRAYDLTTLIDSVGLTKNMTGYRQWIDLL